MENLPSKPTLVEEIVKSATEATGLSKATIETAVWRLLQQGVLYQPEPGVIVKLR